MSWAVALPFKENYLLLLLLTDVVSQNGFLFVNLLPSSLPLRSRSIDLTADQISSSSSSLWTGKFLPANNPPIHYWGIIIISRLSGWRRRIRRMHWNLWEDVHPVRTGQRKIYTTTLGTCPRVEQRVILIVGDEYNKCCCK